MLGSVFVVAACGLVYELVAGAVSSYLLGDAVTQFSLVIGVFLCAMGIGSYLAKFVKNRLLEIFISVEVWIGLVGGASSMALFAVNAMIPPVFAPFFYLLCASLGIMVGIEIPLLVRLLNRGQTVSEALSNVLALDYIGALAGALAFPLIALPFLGLSRASIVFGIMNLAVAAVGTKLLPGAAKWMITKIALAAIFLLILLVFSTRWVGMFEDLLYQDSLVYAKDSRYQRIVITRWREDVRLYLNGHIQFCSLDEARYHESLVIPAMEAAPTPRSVLIMGGGDGLAARELLKYPSVERIVIVDLDPMMTELGKKRPELLELNKGSMNSPKVKVINADAMAFVQENTEFYEVILIDLPDPSSETLAKLYSESFYAMAAKRLSAGGVIATQATSPFFAPDAFWCIVRTMEKAIKETEISPPLLAYPYHVNVPSFGEWGFVMASRRPIKTDALKPSVSTRFLNAETLQAMFAFSEDLQRRDVEPNRLNDPVLYRYYKKGWDWYFGG